MKTAAAVTTAALLGAALAITELHRHAAAALWPLFVFILEGN